MTASSTRKDFACFSNAHIAMALKVEFCVACVAVCCSVLQSASALQYVHSFLRCDAVALMRVEFS